jgi:LAGLIDADG endonuclease
VLKQAFFSEDIFQSAINSSNEGKTFDFSAFISLNPTEYSKIDPAYLEWFIGFSEGDGNFGIKTSAVASDRCTFCINQADLRVLKSIKETLGMGRVTSYKQKTKVKGGEEIRIYGRYLVDNPQDITALIYLFNGHLHIKKCQKKFEQWILTYNNLYNTNIKAKPLGSYTRISTKNCWLVGFWEADGGFSASFTNRLRIKGYIDQDDEKSLMKHISSLFGGALTLRSGTKSVYRVEFQSFASVQKICTYCTSLVGRKKDAFLVWEKIVSYVVNQSHLLPSNFPALKSLVDELQYLNNLFKIKKSVLDMELKELEKLDDLPPFENGDPDFFEQT